MFTPVCGMVCMWLSENILEKAVFYFYYVSPVNGTQNISLGSKFLYPMNHMKYWLSDIIFKKFQDAHILDIFLNSGLVMKLKYVDVFWGRHPNLKSFLHISLSLSNSPGFAGSQILDILVDLVLNNMTTYLFAMSALFLFRSLMLSVEEDRTHMLTSESTQQIPF